MSRTKENLKEGETISGTERKWTFSYTWNQVSFTVPAHIGREKTAVWSGRITSFFWCYLYWIRHARINLNLKLKYYTKTSFSLLLILLAADRGDEMSAWVPGFLFPALSRLEGKAVICAARFIRVIGFMVMVYCSQFVNSKNMEGWCLKRAHSENWYIKW